ncbi:4'-phosphopantetheinyl transferase family protein [Marinobacter persicus]|uniref:4'-phosphopantetheinyl transferase n=1 Tax=Marinobacter persicus TaxID=930118 RepID=A0A2S6G9Z7_9GAMM|nr:4'-phosphopantetheinyl transferase superfamily protein [Marinobacter persicus]PPK53309.1 4'-phosphopantetheinyl transferase [Marinobacter persicus]PPK56146.1 4'-phosphopantetheinyl transferase [Marinobacter persicus]PPK59741.1 4'-phosphopantetheinyl transferase [Marinobacter persicus]
MPGPSNDCNPDHPPRVWLCHRLTANTGITPDWLLPGEHQRLAGRIGAGANDFLASRWLIRQALGRVSGEVPSHCRPVSGRPVASDHPPGLQLSLSHSQGLVACASGGQAVGIDIEPGGRQSEWHRVARRWFSPVEQEWLFRADDPFLFLQVWTLKEAWLKATGRGIAGNLQTLEVRKDFELYGDRPEQTWATCCCYVEGFLVTLVYQTDDPDDPQRWPSITLFEPPPDDYHLEPAEELSADWEPLFHRTIRNKR